MMVQYITLISIRGIFRQLFGIRFELRNSKGRQNFGYFNASLKNISIAPLKHLNIAFN